jgi:hypothetical protein
VCVCVCVCVCICVCVCVCVQSTKAKVRIKKLRNGGHSIEADDLQTTVDTADACARICKVNIPKSNWETLKRDFQIIQDNECYDRIPLEVILAVNLKFSRDLVVSGRWQKRALASWPCSSLGRAPAMAGEVAESCGSGAVASKEAVEAVQANTWDFNNPRFADAYCYLKTMSESDERAIAMDEFDKALVDVYFGNWLFTLVKDPLAHLDTLRQYISIALDLAVARPLTEETIKDLPLLQLAIRALQGMRALLEPCCGAFNNTQAEDVFFLRPVNAQAEDSLAKCALSVGLAFSRELKQNKFWEDAMKEFKNYMGASEVRGHQQKELCTLIAAQVNILSIVPGGASDVDGDTKLSNAKVDLTNLLKKWWDRFPGDRESLRPDALVVPHEKTIKPACLALFNADVRDESMDNFDRLQLLRNLSKKVGLSDMGLKIGEHLLRITSSSAVAKLSEAVKEIYESVQDVERLREAYHVGAAASDDATFQKIVDSFGPILQFIVDSAKADGILLPSDQLESMLSFITDLSKDVRFGGLIGTLTPGASSGLAGDASVFSKVVRSTRLLQASRQNFALRGETKDKRGQENLTNDLLKSVVGLDVLLKQSYAWDGIVQEKGQALIEWINDTMPSVRALVGESGIASLKSTLSALGSKNSHAYALSSGIENPVSGDQLWKADLPDTATKEAILKTFDDTLLNFNGDDLICALSDLTVATASEINKHIREDQTMYN